MHDSRDSCRSIVRHLARIAMVGLLVASVGSIAAYSPMQLLEIAPDVSPAGESDIESVHADSGALFQADFTWYGSPQPIDSARFRPKSYRQLPGFPGLAGVGFPHLDTSNHPKTRRYRSYRRMVSWHDVTNDGRAEPIPHVRCMGLSPKAVARRASQYDRLIESLSAEHNVSANLVRAVITAESCFDPNARSRVGAIGLMQLMPATAEWLKAGDPRIPEQNLRGGIRYLALLLDLFNDRELALAAYNAGPGNVRRHGGIPPFQETQQYVPRVMAHYRRYVAATRLARR